MELAGSRPRVVVIGAGFGGLCAVKELSRTDVDILLIDRNNYHTFIPLLYQVAAAELEPEDIAYPVRTFARRFPNAKFLLAEVTCIDLHKKTVLTTRDEVAYDYLVLAAGSVTNFFGLEAVARHAFGIKDLPEAINLRNHILERFELASYEQDPEKRRAMLTFVIVGGGPTGVEYSATLSELICGTLAKDYPEISFDQTRIVLLEAADRLLPVLPVELSEYARQVLESKGVEVILRAKVVGATAEQVDLEGAPPMPAHTLVWTAGVTANELAKTPGVSQGRGGRIIVTEALHLPDYPEVYVVGDMAYFEQDGRPVPQVAPAAIQQAECAADNIRRCLVGKPLRQFHYDDKGTMVTIGRNQGVAMTRKWSMRGFLAWAAWLAVHIVRLIGFRNRLYVLISWAWSYLFQDRVRLIIRVFPKKARLSDAEEPEKENERL